MRHVVGVFVLVVAASSVDARVLSTRCDRMQRRLETMEQRAFDRCGSTDGCTPKSESKIGRRRTRFVDLCVRLNEVQVLGTHNSYHVQPIPPLFDALLEVTDAFLAWEYTRDPLDVQFATQGVRQIELDVWADPDGGLFAERRGLEIIGLDPVSGLPELDQPGFKVFHVQDIDYGTTCLTFVQCIQTVKAWSDANPGHLPLMVLIEAKDDRLPNFQGFTFAVPVPLGTPEFDDLDAEIRSVFPPEQLITPDDVRGDLATLEDAVLIHGWPTIGESRGRVLFALDNGGAKRDAYRAGHPSLAGRVLFTDASPGNDDAAFVKRNDPFAADIPALVASGYIVRTRTDVDTYEARDNDTGPRDTAIASGAQYVSTDYPVPNPDFGTGYFVEIPDGHPGRCNPINAPPGCRSTALEPAP